MDFAPGFSLEASSKSREFPDLTASDIWMFQALQEKSEMADLRRHNQQILFNLLPAHVAMHFLDNQFLSNMVRSTLASRSNSQFCQLPSTLGISLLSGSVLPSVQSCRSRLRQHIQFQRILR